MYAYLEFGILMKLDTTKISIDFDRLKRAVPLCFVKFGDKKEEEQYIVKQHSTLQGATKSTKEGGTSNQ